MSVISQIGDIPSAILRATSDPRVRQAMLLGSRLESSWNSTEVGDNGTSFGGFQIHLPAHPGVTRDQAENPDWAVHYMLPEYQAAVNRVPDSLWQSNPLQAARQAAYYAERPAVIYPQDRANAAWPAVLAVLGGSYVPGQGDTSGTSTDASTPSLPAGTWQDLGKFGKLFFNPGQVLAQTGGIGDVANAISAMTSDLSTMANMFSLVFQPAFWLRIGAFFVGMMLLPMGLFMTIGAVKK